MQKLSGVAWVFISNWSLSTWVRVPTHFKKSFSILFPYLFNTKLKKCNMFTSVHFLKFLIMKLNFGPCITLNKYWSALPSVEFFSDPSNFFFILNFDTFSILNAYFFNTFSRSWKPILKFNTFSILSIPRGNPGEYTPAVTVRSIKIPKRKKDLFHCKTWSEGGDF